MQIRPYRPEDAEAAARLGAGCQHGENEFVLNPLWETEDELHAEFARHGVDPGTHLLVGSLDGETVSGLVGFLRGPGEPHAGLCCPVVDQRDRGRGLGGELLRAAMDRGRSELGIELVTAGIGTRNRAGYALLAAHGFRPVRQVYVMRLDAVTPEVELPIQGLRVEPAEEQDAEAILEIYRSCGFPDRSLEAMLGRMADGRHDHLVARAPEGGVVAFVELQTHWPRRPWVSYVGVVKSLRDQGLGSSLVRTALTRRFEAGSTAALLTLSPANRTAVRAYEKVGFRRWRLVDALQRTL